MYENEGLVMGRLKQRNDLLEGIIFKLSKKIELTETEKEIVKKITKE